MNSSRTHTETPILSARSFQPRGAFTGSARKPSRARPIRTPDTIALFTTTHASTTAADSARTRPAPDGRLIIASVKSVFTAPPVKTQP